MRFSNFISPIFTRTDDGYKISEKPIHIDKLQRAWDYRAEDNNKAVIDVKEAISFLKKEGYRIYQQDFDLTGALKSPNSPVSKFISWIEV